MMPARPEAAFERRSYGAYRIDAARGPQLNLISVNGAQAMLAKKMSDDGDWQRTYDARQRYFESTVGPLPRDILKIPNLMGVWPRGGLFVIPAKKISELLTVYTTFGFTNPDMPTAVQLKDGDPPAQGRSPAGVKSPLTKGTPVAAQPGTA